VSVTEMQRSGRFQGQSGHDADIAKQSLMTHLRHGRLRTFAAQKHCS
jgi:hypothetical protein